MTPHNPTPAVPDVVPDAMLANILRERASWLESRSFATLSGTVERQAADELDRLHAENARLRDELALWKPMTPEEADAAMEAAEAEPFSEEEIDRIMAKVLDPAYRPTEPEHVQLAAKVKKLQAERDRYRSIVGNVVRWICKYWSPALTQMRIVREATGTDEQAARELCREFGVEVADG